ncbi:MAG: leucyl aminopeptidase [Euryarchaeota archaeon]|nr:leucyl aminopeptidase [Euryarchaeota archaeon]
MKFTVATGPTAEVQADLIAIGAWEKAVESPEARATDRALGGLLQRAAKAEDFRGKEGSRVEVPTAGLRNQRFLLVGLGKRKGATPDTLRKAASLVARRGRDTGARTVAFSLESWGTRDPRRAGQAIAEGALLGTYEFDRYKSKKENGEKKREPPSEFRVRVPKAGPRRALEQGFQRGQIIAESVCFARDLVNEPPGTLTPRRFAEEAQKMAREAGLKCTVLDEKEMEKRGMGGLLGVARGSDEPPRFIQVEYTPKGARRHIALCGKGITFDSGGLDLKPADGMLRMKYDMAGGAAVLGAIRAISQLKPKARVTALVPTTENMPGPRAYKPGDVVRPLGGKTVEIGNTDAEGRVVLSDALGHAVQLGADEIIDVATLTGACMVALGILAAGLFANDEKMARRLLKSAHIAGEKLWRLPLYEEYMEQIKGEIADIKNVGDRYGGAITAALFLREFVGDRKWAHLDIAGAAFTEKDLPYCVKGGTGLAVRTLTEYVTASP